MDYITENDIRNIVQKVMRALPGTEKQSSTPEGQGHGFDASSKTIAVGSDQGGFEMKSILLGYLSGLGYTAIDCGTQSAEPVDYPDFATKVAEQVRSGAAWRGIMIDGAGIGSCMAANKVPGVRAAMCVDYATAFNSREHNDANVLTLGAGLLGVNQVKLVAKTFLETEFGGGRHARRVEKIMEIEQRYAKEGR